MRSPDLNAEQWVSTWLGAGLGVCQPPPMPGGADFNRQVVEFSHRNWVGGLLVRHLEADETDQSSALLHWLKLAHNLALAPSADWAEEVGQVLHALRGSVCWRWATPRSARSRGIPTTRRCAWGKTSTNRERCRWGCTNPPCPSRAGVKRR